MKQPGAGHATTRSRFQYSPAHRYYHSCFALGRDIGRPCIAAGLLRSSHLYPYIFHVNGMTLVSLDAGSLVSGIRIAHRWGTARTHFRSR